MLVLDTDHISVLERADSVERARLIHRLDQAGVTAVVTTIVSYEEQSRGWLSYVARARSATDQVDAYERLARHLETYRRLIVIRNHSGRFLPFARGVADNCWRRPRDVHRS